VNSDVAPCSGCGNLIPVGEFLIWPDSASTAFAVCSRCAMPNAWGVASRAIADDSVPDAVNTDVFPVLGGGWRASCDCGQTAAFDNEPDGWTWVLAHTCTAIDAARSPSRAAGFRPPHRDTM